MRRLRFAGILIVGVAVEGLASTVVPAEPASGDPRGERSWRISVDAGAVHRFDAGLDTGGEFDRDTYVFRLSATRQWTPQLRAGLSLGYEYDDYGFDLPGPLAEAPWDAVRTLSIGLPVFYRASDEWSLFALPRLRYAAEEDAELGDGREAGLLAGAYYRFNDRLSIGPGIGVSSEIESGADVFPILLVDWKITDTLSLETGRGLAASRGPGVTLRWTPEGDWSFGLAARYEKRRFRLDDDGLAPDGVGEDTAVPVALTATYAPGPRFKVSVVAGAELSGHLRLETEDGNRLINEDYDPAAFAGLVLSASF